jgi:hypothetical protein
MQLHEMAPFALVGARIRPRPGDIGQALLLFQFDASLGTRSSLEIMRRRLGSGPAPLGQAKNLEFSDDPLLRQAQAIAHSNTVRRFDAFRVEARLAPVDGGGREAARLEEPGVPKPFVQAVIFALLVGCHIAGY